MSIESRVLKNYTGVLNGISVTGLPQPIIEVASNSWRYGIFKKIPL